MKFEKCVVDLKYSTRQDKLAITRLLSSKNYSLNKPFSAVPVHDTMSYSAEREVWVLYKRHVTSPNISCESFLKTFGCQFSQIYNME